MDEKLTIFDCAFERKHVYLFLAALIGSAVLLRLMIGYTTVHYFDLSFYVDWSTGVEWDFFGAYNNIDNLDYPPLFLFPLFFTGKLMMMPEVADFHPYAMLALKGWQMLFDILMIPLLYAVLRRENELLALGASALWAVNPTVIYNSAYWGQTDSIMMFLLVLTFWLLTCERPVWAGVVMTLACLMKFQSLYFAPVFGLVLLTRFKGKQILQTIGAGAAVALAVFLPFIRRSGWTLPWKVYFGGFEQYQGSTLNAFNYFAANGLNYFDIDTVLFGTVTAETFSRWMLCFGLAMLLFFYFTASEKSVWLLGFVFMQTIFMFTTRMHERYQIPVVVFALIACIVHRSKALFGCYMALTAMTFLNHFLVLEEVFSGGDKVAWMKDFEMIIVSLSFVNLLLYAVTLVVAIRIFYSHGYYGFARAFRGAFSEKWRGTGRSAPPEQQETD